MERLCKRRRVSAHPSATAPLEREARAGIVKLNVGGHVFTTTYSTLQAFPESFLARMFATELQPAHIDNEGNCFIDRDGSLFHYVLQFLRDPEGMGLPQSLEVSKSLQREANFFGLTALEERLQQREEQEVQREREREEAERRQGLPCELSVWAAAPGCQEGKCNCGHPLTATLPWEEEGPWSSRTPHGPVLPSPKGFPEQPNLVLQFHWDPNDRRAQAEVREMLGTKIINVLGTPHREWPPHVVNLSWIRHLDRSMKILERTQGAFHYGGPEASNIPDGDWESKDWHYALWLRFRLQNLAV